MVTAAPDGPLYAEVVAAAVIAAHNHVLRRWLRGDSADPQAELRDVLAELFRRSGEPGEPVVERSGRPAGSTVVVVRSDLPADEAAAVVRDALARGSDLLPPEDRAD